MPKHRVYADHCPYDSSSSDELYSHIRVPRTSHRRSGSVVSSHHHHHVHEPVHAPVHASNNLAVPVLDVGRKRASSTSGLPQPNIIINADGGSRGGSRERTRPRSRSRGRYEDDVERIERRGRFSRSPSPYYRHDYETSKALEKLKIYEQEKAHEEAQKKYKAELEHKRAKEQIEKAEQEEKKKALAKQAIEDWQREEAKKEKEAAEAKEEHEKLVNEGIKAKLLKMNMSPKEVDALISVDKKQYNETAIARLRPTYIRVHRRDLLPETLDCYHLPWSYDSRDDDYLVIKEYIGGRLQAELFEHTKKIRNRKLITSPITTETTLKVNDSKKDKMYLVRKRDRSPGLIKILKT